MPCPYDNLNLHAVLYFDNVDILVTYIFIYADIFLSFLTITLKDIVTNPQVDVSLLKIP